MTTIKTKRVYEPLDPEDGLLILADRLWPRGVSKERLHEVLWAKEITPSTALRKWYHTDETSRWNEFGKRYEKELEANPAIPALVKEISRHPTATLLFAGKDTVHTHTKILDKFLQRQLSQK